MVTAPPTFIPTGNTAVTPPTSATQPTIYPTIPTYQPPIPTYQPQPGSTCSPGCRPVDPTGQPQPTDATIGPPLRCFDLNPPTFGTVSGQCVNAFIGQSCTYACNPGYGLVGAAVLTCGSDGWSSSAPVCLPLLCKNQTAPAHGRLEGACSPGFGGTSCTLICDVGYKLAGLKNESDVTGSITIACNNDRNWAQEFPLCTPITCPSLPTVIPYGTIQPGSQCAPGIALKLCSYQCLRGYAITGSASALLCQLDGTFSAQVPTCTRILCPSVGVVPNAVLDGQCSPGFAYEKCTIKCNPGYRPMIQEIECQANGTFSAPVIDCRRIICPPLTFINAIGANEPATVGEGGSVTTPGSDCTPGLALGTCSIKCKSGYIVTSLDSVDQSIKCDENGTWLSLPERCDMIFCKPKSIPEFAIVSQECIIGKSEGNCEIKCPTNYAFRSQEPSAPSVQSSVQPKCPIDSVTWSGWPEDPCVRKVCDWTNITIAIKNGKRMGLGCTTETQKGLAGECCTYSCERGYALQGKSVVNCVDHKDDIANFDIDDPSKLPKCVIVYCSKNPPLPSVLYADCKGYRVGSTCELKFKNSSLECRPPRALEPKEIICLADGNWALSIDETLLDGTQTFKCEADATIPQCEAGIFIRVDNGKYLGECNPGFLGFECTLICDAGFRPLRDPVRRCVRLSDGTVTWDDTTQPMCITQLCPGITVPLNADASGQCAPGIPSQTCIITCQPGYIIANSGSNSVSLTCLSDGMFDGETPRCVPITCPPLTPPPGGYMSGSCSPGVTGQVCTFSCPPGFYPNGASSIICTSNGGWSGRVPLCLSPDGRQPNPSRPTVPGRPTSRPVTGAPGTNRPSNRPAVCRPFKICCPLLILRKPFLTVNCPLSNNNLFLPESGTSCSLRCTRGELIDGTSRPQRRKITHNLNQNDQRQEFFTKKLIYLFCSRNSNWIGGDVNQIRCSNSFSDSSSYPNKHSDRPYVHVRPWFNVKTNQTRLIVSDH